MNHEKVPELCDIVSFSHLRGTKFKTELVPVFVSH